jgi:hypothetical protein
MNNNNIMNLNNNNMIMNQQQGMNQNINSSQFNNNNFNQSNPNLCLNPLNKINQVNSQHVSKIKTNSKIYQQSNNNDFSKKEEQEKTDILKKTQISIKHSLLLSKYYEYANPDEKQKALDELLADMSFFGDTTKREILKQKGDNPSKYIPIDEAIEKGNSNYVFFVLSILAKNLMNEGCIVAIERDQPSNENENHEHNTTVQFLVNGMYNFKKYIFHFDFGEEKNNELLNNNDEQVNFNRKLKIKLLSLLKVHRNDIIMCNPRNGSYEITAIIKKNNFYQLSEEQLYQELSKDPTFSSIKEIEYSILLSGCKLNPYMLDQRGNNQDGGWGINEKRGGKPYYPPKGWIGYGLRVLDRFDNGDNTWIDYKNLGGEWAVAYHGVGSLLSGSQILNKSKKSGKFNFQGGNGQGYKDSYDAYHQGEKVGEGVYVTPQPDIMENHCGIVNCGNKNYKIGIMTRVKPELIRCPVDKQDYWVINGTDNEVRPYRILIKEL